MIGPRHTVRSAAPVVSQNSVYDLILMNLKQTNKKLYLMRMVYIVKTDLSMDDLIGAITCNIHYLNEIGPSGLITGIQMAYEEHSIIMIEGIESTLLKHFEMYSVLEGSQRETKLKLLLTVDHIIQRYFNRWDYIQIPSPNAGRESTHHEDTTELEKIKLCINQFYNFCEYLLQNTLGTLKTTITDKLPQKVPELIPTVETLNVILDSETLIDIMGLLRTYNQIPQSLLYRDKVWPLASEFVPEHTLKLEVESP